MIAIHIGGAAAIQLHRGADEDRLSGTDIGHGWRILGGDDDAVGRTVDLAVVDDELGEIVAGFVDSKARLGCAGTRQSGRASCGDLREAPEVAQGIAIDISGGAAIQEDVGTDEHRLVRAGMGRGR